MLKKIYIKQNKNQACAKKYDLEAFIDRMSGEGIDAKQITAWDEICSSDALVITDCEAEEFEKARGEFAAKGLCRIFGVGVDTGKISGYSYVIQDFDVSVRYLELIYARMTGQPFEIARSERLIIREMTEEDLPLMYQLYGTLNGCPYIEPLYEYERELEFTKNYIKNMYGFYQYGLWLVFERVSGALIGRIGIENRVIDGKQRQELGYLIGKPWQRHGYAYEASMEIIRYASDELELEELFAAVDKKNRASRELALKLGFEYYADVQETLELYRKKLIKDL